MGTSFGYNLWERLGGLAFVIIGRWYSRQLLINHTLRLSTKTIPEFVAPKASCTHSPYSFWSGEYEHCSRKNCISRIIQEITLKIQSATVLYELAREARKKLHRVSSIISFFKNWYGSFLLKQDIDVDHPDKKLIIMYLTSLYHGLREYTPRGGRKRRKLDVSFLSLCSIPRVENHLNQIRRERNTSSTRCNWKAGKRAWARFFSALIGWGG